MVIWLLAFWDFIRLLMCLQKAIPKAIWQISIGEKWQQFVQEDLKSSLVRVKFENEFGFFIQFPWELGVSFLFFVDLCTQILTNNKIPALANSCVTNTDDTINKL